MSVFEAVLAYTEEDEYRKRMEVMREISDCYWKNNTIDYSKEEYRDAYCILYFTNLVHANRKILNIAYESQTDGRFREWFDNTILKKGTCKILSFGGGPGTDIFGFLLFVMDKCTDAKIRITLECQVLEIYPHWESNFRKLERQFQRIFGESPNWGHGLQVTYRQFDIMNGEISSLDLANWDLTTFVKSAYILNDSRLENILQAIRPGSLALNISNANDYYKMRDFCNKMQGLGDGLDFIFDLDINRYKIDIGDDEQSVVNALMTRVHYDYRSGDFHPACSGKFAATILLKKLVEAESVTETIAVFEESSAHQ